MVRIRKDPDLYPGRRWEISLEYCDNITKYKSKSSRYSDIKMRLYAKVYSCSISKISRSRSGTLRTARSGIISRGSKILCAPHWCRMEINIAGRSGAVRTIRHVLSTGYRYYCSISRQTTKDLFQHNTPEDVGHSQLKWACIEFNAALLTKNVRNKNQAASFNKADDDWWTGLRGW